MNSSSPDGPEKYLDLTRCRHGIARRHRAACTLIPVLRSRSRHHSRDRGHPFQNEPEFIIGEIPGDEELKNRLAVYTFRMCTEAIKVLIEKSLPDLKLFCWGHSTGGEYFYLLEQYGLKNKHIGGLGFGTGMPWIRKEWDLVYAEKSPEEGLPFRKLTDLSRRSPEDRQKRLCRTEPTLG
jgi:hypothetical protein